MYTCKHMYNIHIYLKMLVLHGMFNFIKFCSVEKKNQLKNIHIVFIEVNIHR